MRFCLFLCSISFLYAQNETLALGKSLQGEKHTRPIEPKGKTVQDLEPIHPGVIAYGEFLYWIPFGLDLDYAASGNGANFTATKKHFVEYDWQSGFKAALGWRFPTKWDLIAVFTYLKPHGSDEVTASTVTSAFDKVFGALYQSATSQVDLDYLIGDLEMGRRKFIFRNYIMRFILGFRGAWIKQDWKNTFTQLSGASTISRNQWNAKGGGGRAGVSLQWDSPFYIGLLSKLTFSLLIMREELQYRQTSFSLQNINTHFKQNKLVPTIDFELGLIWEKFFTESWGMNLSMSYQITTWWNLNEKLRQGNALSFDEKTAENLYLQGLTAHAGVFF